MTDKLAYWDTLAGLVPCKVIRIEMSPDPDWTDPFGYKYCVIAKVTADRGPYHKGEQIAQSPARVWPRDCSKPARGSYGMRYYVGRYDWAERVA